MRADARRNRDRILAVAAEVFAARGPTASTEEIAARAGVAIGTIFRHFPTKQALLQAIMKDLLFQLAAQVEALAGDDPAEALFTFFGQLVGQAAEQKAVVDLLAESGRDLDVAESLQVLRDGIGRLLGNAQRVGAVRADIHLDEVLALLGATCQGALRAGWDADLRRRTLAIVFAGLRP